MKLQTELISKAAALREVQRRKHTKGYDFEQNKIFSCEMNDKEEEYLKLGEELLLKADIEYHKQFKMLER